MGEPVAPDTLRSARAGKHRWAAYSLLTSLTMLITFVLAGVGFSQHPRFVQNVGIGQRLSITTGLAWVALRAMRLLWSSRS